MSPAARCHASTTGPNGDIEEKHLAAVARRAIAALADGNTLAAVNILRQELPNNDE